jgi:hypothetical protein
VRSWMCPSGAPHRLSAVTQPSSPLLSALPVLLAELRSCCRCKGQCHVCAPGTGAALFCSRISHTWVSCGLTQRARAPSPPRCRWAAGSRWAAPSSARPPLASRCWRLSRWQLCTPSRTQVQPAPHLPAPQRTTSRVNIDLHAPSASFTPRLVPVQCIQRVMCCAGCLPAHMPLSCIPSWRSPVLF